MLLKEGLKNLKAFKKEVKAKHKKIKEKNEYYYQNFDWSEKDCQERRIRRKKIQAKVIGLVALEKALSKKDTRMT